MRTVAGGKPAAGSNTTRTKPAIKTLFKAADGSTRHDLAAPKPDTKRRGESGGNPAIRQRPQYASKPAARGRYAAL